MTDITIPPEAHSAAHKTFRSTYDATGSRREALDAAFLAMLKNWPGMRRNKPSEGWFGPYLILPLTQENTNAET